MIPDISDCQKCQDLLGPRLKVGGVVSVEAYVGLYWLIVGPLRLILAHSVSWCVLRGS